MFTYLPNSQYDWNFTYSRNDAKYHRNQVIEMPQGKMLGGSSSLSHLLYMRGGPEDYAPWAVAANDDSWGWDGIYKYLLKSERLVDEEILASSDKKYHGVDGYHAIKREPSNETNSVLKSFEELGSNNLLDINGDGSLGYAQAMFSNAFFRSSGAYSYLTPIKNRSNLHVLKNTEVTKVIFDGTQAIGVEATKEDGTKLTLKVSKEVILTAGAFNTPKLLMLSGVGPKKHLESFGISVLSDLPVGQNLQDHVCSCFVHTMGKSDAETVPADVTKFPAVTTIGLKAINPAQTYADYQAINFHIPPNSQALLAICMIVFTYSKEICQSMFDANNGTNVMYTVHNLLHPEARGQVLLRSANPGDSPIVELGALSVEADIERSVEAIEDFVKVINTEYFKSVNAKFVDLGLEDCKGLKLGSKDYWRCYVKATIASMFNYSSTCSLGTVVDGRLRVMGTSGLRVADASVMPTNTIGKIKAPVMAIAEKGADILKADYGLLL